MRRAATSLVLFSLAITGCRPSGQSASSRAFSRPVGIRVEPTSGKPYHITLVVTKPSVSAELVQSFTSLIVPVLKACDLTDGTFPLNLTVADGRIEPRTDPGVTPGCVETGLRGKRLDVVNGTFNLRAEIEPQTGNRDTQTSR